MGKPSFLLAHLDLAGDIPFDLRSSQYILYQNTPGGLSELTHKVAQALRDYRRSPRRARGFSGARLSTPFFIEWDRLERVDAENLCRELLSQMGYQRVDWLKKVKEFDLIAELPKKDPDGYEYRELWLVAMGRNAPPERVLDMVTMEPDFLLHQLERIDERFERLFSGAELELSVSPPIITFLVILLGKDSPVEELDRRRWQFERRLKRRPYPLSMRVRIWDRNYLTSLVQQFPKIGYKYFSDEGALEISQDTGRTL